MNLSIDLKEILQILAIIVSAILIGNKIKHQCKANEINLYKELSLKWHNLKMLESRKKICELFGQNENTIMQNERFYEFVASYFDQMGYYVKKGYINKTLIWNNIGYSLERYYPLVKSYIDRKRTEENDNTLFDNFDILNKKLSKISKKREVLFHATSLNLTNFIDGETKKIDQLLSEKNYVDISNFNHVYELLKKMDTSIIEQTNTEEKKVTTQNTVS